jgi:hypothetical protein
MACPVALAHPVSYLLVTAGSLLAAATSFEPQLTGAYRLAFGYLLCGLIPYIVYGSFSQILDGCALLLAGLMLFGVDVTARLTWDIHAAGQADLLPAIGLCTVLVLVVFPAAAMLGRLAGRRVG